MRGREGGGREGPPPKKCQSEGEAALKKKKTRTILCFCACPGVVLDMWSTPALPQTDFFGEGGGVQNTTPLILSFILFQLVGRVRNELQFHTVQQKEISSWTQD